MRIAGKSVGVGRPADFAERVVGEAASLDVPVRYALSARDVGVQFAGGGNADRLLAERRLDASDVRYTGAAKLIKIAIGALKMAKSGLRAPA